MTFRCSAASDRRGEPLAGTASTVRAFLLVECTGPWGVEAVRDCRLPGEVKRRLLRLGREGVRPLLIRRHASDSVRVFAGYAGEFLETAELDDVRALLDLDLTELGRGHSPGLTPVEDELFLVCTHGRHDACCAERGRPLWRAVEAAAPEHTWQVSHIGGDRFAANVLVLPHALYYGRVRPEDADGLVRAHREGRLDLDRLRGRSTYPFPVQAAEIHLRRRLGLRSVGPLPVVAHDQDTAVFAVEGRHWQVTVRRETTREVLTCRADGPSAGWAFHLVSVTDLGPWKVL